MKFIDSVTVLIHTTLKTNYTGIKSGFHHKTADDVTSNMMWLAKEKGYLCIEDGDATIAVPFEQILSVRITPVSFTIVGDDE